ncbi:MAG: type I DNA topoisomerase [Prochlorotrichaceae cyanobacterium]|jgi:DNA topoisomerase-1
MTTLVIVESPTKARTIRNYLPADFQVAASMGHIRDLPQSASDIPEEIKKDKNKKSWASLGVNVEDGFAPLYIVPRDKQKVVKELKAALKDADELLLATDEDREGESISWHLLQVLKPKVPTRRMVFHEITQEAIQEALNQCREVDDRLVHAQETRRILDRLVGYTLSPLLWKKIAGGLSAGRVQSVAVRLLVRRERERRAFRKGSYWDLKAVLSAATAGKKKGKTTEQFEAKLVSLNDRRVATGSDFDEQTGQIAANRDVVLLGEAEAQTLRDRLQTKPWSVTEVEERPVTRKPSPPFTTSTLQQEANRKLRLSARDTMRIAQNLYERGFITYMRTDSVHLSQQAIAAARDCVTQKYGTEYLSPSPRQYTTKSKNAQEAHEAIRPAGSHFRTPQETGLRDRELALYDLIWKRTVACQMAEARQTNITLQIAVEEAIFRASGKRIDFPGFFRAYVEGSDDPEAALEDQEVLLPTLKVGDQPGCESLTAVSHETQPPARFTEASLVKALESEGIGRPSTYASIIGTIVDRNYAVLNNNSLTPTFTAFAVTSLLEKHFPDLVDTRFTARMEQTLDDISNGEAEWLPYLEQFYNGEEGLSGQVKHREDAIDPTEARTLDLADLNVKVRIGRYGAYVETEIEGEETSIKASLPRDLTPADLNNEQVDRILKEKIEGPDQLGEDPETHKPIYIRQGPYGPYVQLGDEEEDSKKKPKRVSLPKGMAPEDASLEYALGLLSLPRLLGTHPETGGKIQANLGRFGPFVVHTTAPKEQEYRSLKKEDDVLTIDLERALQLLAEPKRGRGGGRTKTPLKELGLHPEDQEPVNVYQGPYGIYVKHGKVNAGLPEGETIETLTLAIALTLLSAKTAAKGNKSTAKSTTRKGKTSAKTADAKAAKKTTAKTTTKSTKAAPAASSEAEVSKTASKSSAKSTKTPGKKTSKTSTQQKTKSMSSSTSASPSPTE